MSEPTPPQGIDIICRWEGWHRALPDGSAAPYVCPAGVTTIGYGTTYWEDGRRIKMSDAAITREVGRQLLLRQLQTYAATVDRVIKVPVHPSMRAALISLTYNIGTGAFAKSSVARLVNQRRWSEVPRAFQLWRNGGGRVLTGLLNRRIDESNLFMRGVAAMGTSPVSAASSMPMPERRPVPTPQTASAPSWWQKILQGVVDGLGAPHPVPA